MRLLDRQPRAGDDAAVATKAVLRAADRLSLSHRTLARVLGVSDSTVSRMRAGTYVLPPHEKPFELALLFIRLYRALDAIVGGDERVAAAWMQHENHAFGASPLSMIQRVAGLMHVLAYLDARRALA